MSNDEPDKECSECHNKFFLFSYRGARGDLTISIPAEDEQSAMSILDDAVKEPNQWNREHALEKQLGIIPKTGRKKGVKPWTPPIDKTGPMFG